jgi:O-antigen/teichoic acid export membrane protein
MRRALRYTIVVVAGSTALAVVLWVASGYLDALLGRSFEEAETVGRWLTPVLPLTALNQGPANGLAGLGRLGLRGVVVGLAALLSLLLYIFLIPKFGWQGAAVATIIAEAFTAAALWVAFVIAYRQARAAVAS